MRNRNFPAHSPAPATARIVDAETRKRQAGRVATKLNWAEAIRAARPTSGHEMIGDGLREARAASVMAAGWTVGLHALPMQRADRMESLKDRKQQDRAGGIRRSRRRGSATEAANPVSRQVGASCWKGERLWGAARYPDRPGPIDVGSGCAKRACEDDRRVTAATESAAHRQSGAERFLTELPRIVRLVREWHRYRSLGAWSTISRSAIGGLRARRHAARARRSNDDRKWRVDSAGCKRH